MASRLVLVIGDLFIPDRASFKKLLTPGKIGQILCLGNLTDKETYEFLRQIAPDLQIVKGNFDVDAPNLALSKVVTHGSLRIGFTHGHTVIPPGDADSLLITARHMDVDVLLWGGTHKFEAYELEGKFFVNPGSATGAFSTGWFPDGEEPIPSFCLMDVQGDVLISLAVPSAWFISAKRAAAGLDDFVADERPIALQSVLSNIGVKATGADRGVIVASPSKEDPDYFYTWTRDSALTAKMLIDTFIAGDTSLRQQIEDYISAEALLQTVANPSGDLTDGSNLGEPKFEVNSTAFTGPWGRPQRDGPALRATALIAYSGWLLLNGDQNNVSSKIWPIISNDLNYVGQYWNQTGFDLWEEVDGSSFFTLAVQHRALVEGQAFAERIGKTCTACKTQAPEVLCFLQAFWNGAFVTSNINVQSGRNGRDANSILGSIHTFDPMAGCDDLTFQPCSSRALANHKAVTDSFRSLYAVNSDRAQGAAVAVGRYTEDVYFGGNPWYLTTLAAAEQLYDAVYQINRTGFLVIDVTSLPFFQDLDPSVAIGSYPTSSEVYANITSAIRKYADGYISVVREYTPADGSFAEQYSRADGLPLSAADLTWCRSIQ
ncbi:MAG: hypothetical protein Q9178_003936 [Gyalolechia marmorata]